MIKFKVNTEKFEENLTLIMNRFLLMAKTMVNVAKVIELQTIPYVPLDTSNLEQSFEYVVSSNRSGYVWLMVGYDAVDEHSGFHYAEYQHENELHHPKRGRSHYLRDGIANSKGEWMELIETDYLSLFTGGKMITGILN